MVQGSMGNAIQFRRDGPSQEQVDVHFDVRRDDRVFVSASSMDVRRRRTLHLSQNVEIPCTKAS